MPEPIVRPSAQMPAKSTHPAIVLLRLSMLAAPFAGARSSERLIDLALPYWGTRGGARDERPIGAVAPEAWPRYAPRRILERRTWAAIVRQSVVEGRRVSLRGDFGGRLVLKKKKT